MLKILLTSMMVFLSACSTDPKITGRRELFLPPPQDVFVDKNLNQKNVLCSLQPVTHWPQDRFCSTHEIPHAVFNVQKAQLLWSIPIGKKSKQNQMSNMVATKDTVFCADSFGNVKAVSLKTRSVLWSCKIADQIDSVSKIGGLALLDAAHLLVTVADGRIVQIDTKTGKIQKTKMIDGVLRSAPCVLPSHILIQTSHNAVFALNPDLQILWKQFEIPEDVLLLEQSVPSSDGSFVVASFSSGEFKVYDLSSGQEVWSDFMIPSRQADANTSMLPICALPVIHKHNIVVFGHNGQLLINDIASGTREWGLDISGRCTPVVSGDWIFVIDDALRIYCLDKDSGHTKWISNIPLNERGDLAKQCLSPLLAGGCLITVTNDGRVLFFDLNHGNLVKTLVIKGMIPLHSIIINQTLFIQATDGKLYAIG